MCSEDDKEPGRATAPESSLSLRPSRFRSLPWSVFLSSEWEDIRRSSTSKEANAEGNARERVALGANMGDVSIIGYPKASSTSANSCDGFSCAFFIFMASFDRLGSEDDVLLYDTRGESSGVGGKAGTIDRGDFRL